MKRTARILFPALLALVLFLLLSSCATRRPYGDEQYFQGLGLDGEFVVTVNAELLDPHGFVESGDPGVDFITDRMTRLSIALYDNNGTAGPVTEDFSEFDYYGAIEGEFPKSLVNSALSLSSVFTSAKDKSTKLRFFSDNESGLQVAVTAEIVEAEVRQLEMPASQIRIINIPDGKRAVLQTEDRDGDGVGDGEVPVSVYGLPTALGTLRAQDISGTVDISELVERIGLENPTNGTYTISVTLTLPDGIYESDKPRVFIYIGDAETEG